MSGRAGVLIAAGGAVIETYIDGAGPSLVILPSYGRDGGADYDDITARVADAGWQVLRPQPRGVGRSAGPMSGLTMRDLAADVTAVIRKIANGPAVLLGHAFGNMLARLVATDHPELAKAVILAAAEASVLDDAVKQTPFIAGDPTQPRDERLAALRKAFFAPGHDPSVWLSGWYPQTLAMQRAAAAAVPFSQYWACGTIFDIQNSLLH